jgi:cellulose synthase/poly-beta-1,6-N-acetylglucosamine synthase-like glycosyltransferase
MDLLSIIYLIIIFVVLYYTSFQLNLFLKFKGKVREKAKIGKLPKVSLIVPAYNEEKTIVRTIKNLLRLNYPKNRLEIIVVDDGSKDKTYEKAKKFEKFGVKVFTKPNGGKANALNFGLKHAKNELVGVVDCDTILEKDALIKCVNYFNNPKVACVTSRILQRRKKRILERWQDIELKIIAYTRKLAQFLNLITATPGPLSLYRKNVLIKLKGFDEKCVLEDNEIAWRLIFNGYEIKMAYDAKAYTNMPSKLKEFWRQRVRWGIGGLQIIKKYFSTFLRNHPIGTYILPSSIIGYIFSTIGIGLFFYLLLSSLIEKILYFVKTIWYGGNPFIFSLSIQPDLFLFYGLILFSLSFFFVIYILRGYKKTNIIDLITFIFVYLAFFPIIASYSIYKFLRLYKQLKIRPIWLTK